MKERLGRILTILCVLTLVCGCLWLNAVAEGSSVSYAVTASWNDDNNLAGIRPDSVSAVLRVDGKPDQTVTLNAANSWTAVVTLEDVAPGATYAWEIAGLPAGYVSTQQRQDDILTVIRNFYEVQRVSVQAKQQWTDNDNSHGVRPSSVNVRLLADGVPYAAAAPLNSGNGWTRVWKDLPKFRKGTDQPVVYTVEPVDQPQYYDAAVITGSQDAGYVITNTLRTGNLTIVKAFSGVPADASLGALSFTVTGPDHRMPMTVNYSQFTGGAYQISNLLPGAYLVQETGADTLVEGYTLVTGESALNGTAQVEAGGSATIKLRNSYRNNDDEIAIEARDTEVTKAEMDQLTFRILGPDPSMPMTLRYSQFIDGKYELKDLVPGDYVVFEENAGTLIDRYELTTDSTTAVAITVGEDGTAQARLVNRYVQLTHKPATTPEPSDTPEPTEPTDTPTPKPEEEKIDIPVTKTWVDNNNKDGNRPASVTIHLYADGVEVSSAVLTGTSGWQYTFTGLPKYAKAGTEEAPKVEIAYTITEDPVFWYVGQVDGFTVTNVYHPEVTSVSVSKIWNDNNNAAGMRPASIYVTLSNGTSVVLSQANGWTATVNNLPTRINGQPAVYTWHEQEVLGYVQTGYTVSGNTTIFTNSMFHRPELPPDKNVPKKRGETYFLIDDYDTPLGVEVIINHVGDCFD